MAACLVALSDNDIHTSRLQPERFRNRRRARHDPATNRLHSSQKCPVWQAKMKAYYLRLGLLDDVTPGLIKRLNIYPRRRNRWIDAELAIIRQQAIQPSLFAIGCCLSLDVAKEVDVNRLVSYPTQRPDHFGRDLGF